MGWKAFVICLGLIGDNTCAEAQSGPDRAALDEVVRLGTVAALAPLCRVRDEAWAFDVRRAAILEATRTQRPDDPALKLAPGSDWVVSALSFAEGEALEDFAASAPAEACVKLVDGSDLARADEAVQRFRNLKSNLKPSS